jgi:hypothetical protein
MLFSGGSGYLFNVNVLTFTEVGSSSPVANNIQEFSPIHDAYLESGTRYNVEELRAEVDNRISYLMFDLSSVSEPITSATLNLTVGSDAGYGAMYVYLGSHSSWTETNLSESNKPLQVSELKYINQSYESGKTIKLDLAGIESGKVITLIVVHAKGNDVSFASSENGNSSARPTLTLTTGTNARVSNAKYKVTDVSSGADQLKEEVYQSTELRIYPNPASEYLVLPITESADFMIISNDGKIVKRGSVSDGRSIDVSQLKEGMYVLRILLDGISSHHKILIKR